MKPSLRSLVRRFRWNPKDWEIRNVASVARSENLGLDFGICEYSKYGKRNW